MAFEFSVDDNGLSVNLASASSVAGKKLIENMRLLGQEYVRDIRDNRLSGQMLTVRTGQGRRSIFYRLEASDVSQGVELVIGADLSVAKYMRAQALGATITPKRGRFLAIPIGAAKTAKGVARFSAHMLMQNPGAAGYDGSFIRKSIIFGVKNRGIVPLFVLKPSVTLPSRDYMQASKEALEGRTHELLEDVAKATVQTIVEKK
jgi:hypothetical protein